LDSQQKVSEENALSACVGRNSGDKPGEVPQGSTRSGGERGKSGFGWERDGETSRQRSHQLVIDQDSARTRRRCLHYHNHGQYIRPRHGFNQGWEKSSVF